MSFVDTLLKIIKNPYFIYVVLFVVLAICAWVFAPSIKNYFYNDDNLENFEDQIEDFDDGSSKTADLYFFYTTWCPHCKKAKPVWEQLSSELETTKINGSSVKCIAIDCDEDSETADKFKVEGYPTIKLVKGGDVIEFDANPNYEELMKFLKSVL